GKKKDFSCSDRKFACNIGLTFKTPEEFFLGYPMCSKYSFGEFDPRKNAISAYNPMVEPADASFIIDGPEVVVFVGFPASGKTTFYEKIMKPNGYIHVSRDILGSWQKCVNICKHVESRRRYICCAQDLEVPVRCFHFLTTMAEAKHNNRFRELTTERDFAKVTDIAYNTFKSRFVPPQETEGFKEVLRITLNASVKDEYANLYIQFLL
ncbi:Bifunctional polynucleotide phosphatase/kinase, partial [Geodia barretti]